MKPLNYTWIVDDDDIFVFTVQKMMRKNKLTHKLDIFSNGMDAKLQLDKSKQAKLAYPEVILLDINMPILDGWQFMDAFSQFDDKDKIIIFMVSSSIDPKDRSRSEFYEDIEDFIVKPVTIEDLKQMVDQAQSSMNIS